MSATRNPLHTNCPWLVGMGFFTADANFAPDKAWPGTQWQKVEGRFILAASAAHPLGKTGGEETHTLTEDELPVIDGAIATAVTSSHGKYGASGHAYGTTLNNTTPTDYRCKWQSASSNVQYGYGYKFGGGKSHNNMPPYVTRIYWERVG